VPFHTLVEANGRMGGARNLDVLRERLSKTMLRRVRREVLAQLPARTDTRVPVELSELQRERHDELRQPIAELAARAERRPLTPAEFMQLMQLLTSQRIICNGIAQQEFEHEWPRLQHEQATPELLARLSAPKLSALRALIEQVVLDQGRKAVVFSQWRSMLQLSEWAVRDLLQAAGMQARFFTGAESQRTRQQALLEFQDDPKTSVLFLSDAGGVGLNLQHAASCCINLELPWNPAVLEQRIGRIYRLGQKRPIDVYNLVSEGGIETRIARLIAQKQAVFGALFDGTSDEVQFEGQTSFVAGVKQLVDPLPVVAPAADSGDDLPAACEAAPPAPAPRELPVARELRVERLPDGGLRVDAPPELAAPLAALLEALARGLRS
jgi:SNF2 family DNA or RNA helicase